MTATPAISVVMPVYNAGRYVRSAIESILGQTYADFELIAVDDGSTDGSETILDELRRRDPRIRILSRPNTGIVGALNDGLALAQGEFIARMDADDWAFPSRFQKQMDYLRTHPECVCVGTAFAFMDADGYLLEECVRVSEHVAIERELLNGNGGIIIHPTTLMRRAAVSLAGGYRENAQWIEDLDLYLRLARIGQLANISEVLLRYRFHAQSVNFTRNFGRHERMLNVLAEAHAARSLPFDSSRYANTWVSSLDAGHFRDFAITSLKFGREGRPMHYAFKTLLAEPLKSQSWRTLSYVIKHKLGLIRDCGC